MQEKIYVRAVLFFIMTLIIAVIITWYPILLGKKELIPVSTESAESLTCQKGNMQSPIDIHQSEIKINDEAYLQLNYAPSLFQMDKDDESFRATSLLKENSVQLKDETYQLVHFHFHRPSEHRINEKQYKMELHLVHENGKGEKLVVAALFNVGEENELLTKILEDESITTIDLSKLIHSKTAYSYSGSLTTPPCTENVQWIVLSNPLELSKEQLEIYTKLYPQNNRPVQKINHRIIEQIPIN